MTIGPLELIVIGFEGNNFRGDIAEELEKVQKRGDIRIIDLLFVTKDAAGNVIGAEIEDVNDAYRARYDSLVDDLRGMLTEEDVVEIGEQLEPNTAAMLMLFEHLWAVGLKEAVVKSGGRLLADDRISPEAVEAIEKDLEAAMAR